MLTLRDILNWDILAGHELIAGAEGLGAEVRSITVIDAPDAMNWVKAQEIVVTSTYPVQDNPDALVLLVEQLSARKAAGLGVKLTRFLREVPENARTRADELGLTIISLPGDLAWSDLIGAIFAHVSDAGQIAHLSAIYRGFSQHRTRVGTLSDLFDLVVSFVSLPLIVALEDESGLQVECRGIPTAAAEALAERLMQVTGGPEGTQQLSVGEVTLSFAHTGAGPGGAGVVAVLDRQQPVSEPDLECLRLAIPLMQGILERAAQAKEGAPSSGERLFNDLLDPLLPEPARALLIAQAFPLVSKWHMVAARVFDPGGIDSSRLTLRLRQFARRHGALLRVSDAGEHLLAIPADTESPRADVLMLHELEQLWRRQADLASAFRYGLGHSGPGSLASDAIIMCCEATEALAFGIRLNGFNQLHRHEDLLLLRLLAHPAVIAESRGSVRRLLAPLLALGEAGAPLIETLRVWLQEDESIPRTANRLGLHANSVRHRLVRGQQALGLTDLGTSARLRLYVALQLLPMLREGKDD